MCEVLPYLNVSNARCSAGRVAFYSTILIAFIFGVAIPGWPGQAPAVRAVDENMLREYTGVYQWSPNAFLYLQMWDELTGFGKPALVAFDESGWVRLLYPVERDQFFVGPGAAVSTAVESRVEFHRDGSSKIT